MAFYVHRLDADTHKLFLDEKRRDPVTHEQLRAGDEIVICASDKVAFLKDSWLGNCPVCGHCNTLVDIPANGIAASLRIRRVVNENSRSNITFSSVLIFLLFPFKIAWILIVGILWSVVGVIVGCLSPFCGILIGGAGCALLVKGVGLFGKIELLFLTIAIFIGATCGGVTSFVKISKKIMTKRNKINKFFFCFGVAVGVIIFIIFLLVGYKEIMSKQLDLTMQNI